MTVEYSCNFMFLNREMFPRGLAWIHNDVHICYIRFGFLEVLNFLKYTKFQEGFILGIGSLCEPHRSEI